MKIVYTMVWPVLICGLQLWLHIQTFKTQIFLFKTKIPDLQYNVIHNSFLSYKVFYMYSEYNKRAHTWWCVLCVLDCSIIILTVWSDTTVYIIM